MSCLQDVQSARPLGSPAASTTSTVLCSRPLGSGLRNYTAAHAENLRS